jgi:hypothetical protein
MDAARTIAVLTEQAECYRRLAKLAQVQHQYVQDGSADGLLEVLRQRQEQLERLSTLDRELQPRPPDWLAALPGSTQASARELLREIRQLLEAITAADRDDALALQQQRLSVGRQIDQTAAARVANRKYAAAAYGARPAGMDVTR